MPQKQDIFFGILCVFLCNLFLPALAQENLVTLSGFVKNSKGEPLPYAILTIAGTTNGTVSNADGSYSFKLAPDTYTFRVKYLGYQTHTEVIELFKDKKITFKLIEEDLYLPDVIITQDGRDPAYGIIKNAVDRKAFYKKLNPAYQFKAYTKTKIQLSPDSKMDVKKLKEIVKDLGNGVLYLSETISEVYVKKPDIKEKIIASRVSGNKESFSLFGNLFLQFSLYEEKVEIGSGERAFISPLANNTFFYYDFKLLGSTRDNNRTIYKIQIIPKRKHDPVFQGTIYIVDQSFAVQGFDLLLTDNQPIEYVDSIRVYQTYVPYSEEVWMPFQVGFEFKGSFLKLHYSGSSSSVLSEYQFTTPIPQRDSLSLPKVDSKPTTNPKKQVKAKTTTPDKQPNKTKPKKEEDPFKNKNEILTVVEGANKKDSIFWVQTRPVPLDSLEASDFAYKDSIANLVNDPHYADSLNRKNNKLTYNKLMFGYTYKNIRNKNTFQLKPLLENISFNTMEGFLVNLSGTKTWWFGEIKRTKLGGDLRYGFSNRKISYQLLLDHYLYPKQKLWVGASGGYYVSAFGEQEQISTTVNELYSLYARQNYLKMFQRTYAQVYAKGEVTNGLKLKAAVTWEDRHSLDNTSDYSFKRSDRPYLSNIYIPNHQALIVDLSADIVFANQYISVPEGKMNLGSAWPELTLRYRQGLPFSTTASTFQWAEAILKDDFNLKLFGTLNWMIRYGSYFGNRDKIYFPDYQHFKGNQTIFRKETLRQFSLFDYYSNSTAQSWLEAHIEHQFGGFILNKVPLIRRLKWHEFMGAHFLDTPTTRHLEVSAGIGNILKVVRFDYHYRILGNSAYQNAVTVTINIPFNRE
ncbi:MAG: DUF5686 and carboxypeptidase regulatory-like domain-containing protein [Bacteroidia bacterium]|nr:DUF5686 and carboxypeptidase regulatory-like domain-containing protein [Bacteroidia bacterium]